MKTITVCIHNDKDGELLKNFIETTEFNDEIEVFEDEDEFTDEDIAEWDSRVAEYEKDPSKGKTIEDVKEILNRKHGV